MIKSFRCRETDKIWDGEISLRFPIELQNMARKKLRMLHQTTDLRELTIFPGNRLEALRGNRGGQYSIRINQKYRICFKFIDTNCYDVELVDYH